MKRIGLVLTVFVLVLVVVLKEMWGAHPVFAEDKANDVLLTAVSAAEACTGDNLLTNPSFEGDYVPYVMDAPGHDDCQTWNQDEPNQYCERVKTADGWHPWWRDDPR
ncbi:MAG: hypothetical protein DWQ04_19485, partial [Chloroflexi bacterium]